MNQPKYAEFCDHAQSSMEHLGHTLFSTRLREHCRRGHEKSGKTAAKLCLRTLMTSLQPWLTARDLHKVKSVNIPARRRKASPPGNYGQLQKKEEAVFCSSVIGCPCSTGWRPTPMCIPTALSEWM